MICQGSAKLLPAFGRLNPVGSVTTMAAPMRLFLAGLAVLLLILPAAAQEPQGGGRHGRADQTRKSQTGAPKADEGAYDAALKQVPNQPFDPWQKMRTVTPPADPAKSR
jgi:hypothetical protein